MARDRALIEDTHMLSCRETTQLISESLERKLPIRQRMAVRAHLLMCRFCSRFRKQLIFMEKAVGLFVENEKEGNLPADRAPSLSPGARARIKLSIRQESK
jgi:hypothetical protein